MITWITGWPHNGSTIVRQIMKDSLGLKTYSVYPEPKFEYLFGDQAITFGEAWQNDPQLRLEYYYDRPEMYYIKTHEPPIKGDDSPAIYVVRDGRDSVSALSHFWKVPVRHIIGGLRNRFGGLSGHYNAWDPENRKNTIVIKFEDMVERPNDIVDALVEFLDAEKIADYVDNFDEDAKKWPQLFNDRIGGWKKTMTEADIKLFDKCHGKFMREVGYYE